MNELVLERQVEVSPSLLWSAWKDPEILKQWWAPRPYEVPQAYIDLSPGGRFDTQMRSPEGQDWPLGQGCILEVVPYRKIAFTSSLQSGYQPVQLPSDDSCMSLSFSAIITMEPKEQGTLYTARARHATPEQCLAHQNMGFQEGWGTCLEQLCQVASSLKGRLLTIQHQVVIEAEKDKIWQTLFSSHSYSQWTRVWDKESRFEGSWELGQKIIFLGSQQGGLYGIVESHRPQEELIVRFDGILEKGQEIADPTWAEARESYRLREVPGGVELQISSQVPTEYAESMDTAWPKALQNLRVLCEIA